MNLDFRNLFLDFSRMILDFISVLLWKENTKRAFDLVFTPFRTLAFLFLIYNV